MVSPDSDRNCVLNAVRESSRLIGRSDCLRVQASRGRLGSHFMGLDGLNPRESPCSHVISGDEISDDQTNEAQREV